MWNKENDVVMRVNRETTKQEKKHPKYMIICRDLH